MVLLHPRGQWSGRTSFLALVAASLILSSTLAINGQQARPEVLQIGSSNSWLTGKKDQEKGAIVTLKTFIKDETGLENEIAMQNGWRQLAARLAQGQLHIGVFQGFEFAWATGQDPRLKTLMVAINIFRYPVVYVLVNKNNPARDFAALKGQTLSIPAIGQGTLHLFLEQQCQRAGSNLHGFFSKITEPDNVEDALDDVVDGATQATVVDRAALEAFKSRKPARHGKLRAAAQSQPFPPPVLAYYDGRLDEATRLRFQQGMLNGMQKEHGQTLLTLCHFTQVEGAPADFEQVLAATRKAYPPLPGK
jgi:ABC-type phosphate/phosphonate transport system substrate-binding protein